MTQDAAFDEQAVRTSLQASLDEAEWSWLKAHSDRGAVIWVSPGLPIVEVGVRIAGDDTTAVRGWLSTGQLRKPTHEQLASWEALPTTRFWSLVVQPYVLIQERVEAAPEGARVH
jgi:hypothetical protein